MTTALLSTCLFIAVLWLLGIARVAANVLVIAKQATVSMRDESLDEESREKAVQRASIQLFGAFFWILMRGVAAFLVAFLPIWIANLAGIANTEDVVAYLSRWDVIVIVSLVVIGGYIIWMRLWPSG